ncbi:hypothetical protein [Inquilinus sp. Marseille-Q2685]|uniref:hypothetical protein n=1 Tax=Inquilinus sp. Marseille-Q2685 TaxID=2866581 RepID=UPI001CE4257D|nr:hypothetical protein [Inquilinus sp. Marseille-Q2685]
MSHRPELDRDLSRRIDALLKESGEKNRSGDTWSSIEIALRAWDIIPESKEDWDFYPQTIAASLVKKYALQKDIDHLRRWIDITYTAYDDTERTNHFVMMLEGSSLLDAGLDREAMDVFRKIYERFGAEGFRGDQKKYLDLYLKEKS